MPGRTGAASLEHRRRTGAGSPDHPAGRAGSAGRRAGRRRWRRRCVPGSPRVGPPAGTGPGRCDAPGSCSRDHRTGRPAGRRTRAAARSGRAPARSGWPGRATVGSVTIIRTASSTAARTAPGWAAADGWCRAGPRRRLERVMQRGLRRGCCQRGGLPRTVQRLDVVAVLARVANHGHRGTGRLVTSGRPRSATRSPGRR